MCKVVENAECFVKNGGILAFGFLILKISQGLFVNIYITEIVKKINYNFFLYKTIHL